MDSKKIIYLGMIVGSAIGSYVPVLWGDSLLSFSSIILTAVGGFLGIWFGLKISQQ